MAAYYAFVAQRCKESFGLSLAEAQCLGGLCCSGAWVAGYKCQQPSLGFGYTDIYTDILAVYFVALMCFERGKYFAKHKVDERARLGLRIALSNGFVVGLLLQ